MPDYESHDILLINYDWSDKGEIVSMKVQPGKEADRSMGKEAADGRSVTAKAGKQQVTSGISQDNQR